ncbi:MAG: hypothetical protein HY474_02315 [Candidatus Sungbacteria bacterium]|uniref:Pilus assembly protein PilO n=1 Tax=Candidatus Sungiibacteriota bacterium TaxID=2750080 RepID=A0A932YYB9_9BACT|nr:hypothetical protein [Candidatus Sungbacteria bacterium]
MSRIAAAIIFLALAAAAIAFGALPQWRRVVEVRSALAELQSFHTELTALAANRDALIAEYNTIAEADLAKLQILAPSKPKTTDVLIGLEELARRNGIILGQVDFTAPASQSGALPAPAARRWTALPVTLSLRGSYDGFRNFLTTIERDLRLFDSDEIIFSSPGGREATASLKGRMYFRR